MGIGIVVVIADHGKPDRLSHYDQFVNAVLDNSPEWDYAFVAEGRDTIDVWGYDQGHRCNSDHIIGIVTYAVYKDGTGEFINDFNMRHISLGNKADPNLVALIEQIRELRCTTPCHSRYGLGNEKAPAKLTPCILKFEDGEMMLEQIDYNQLDW